MNTRHHDAGIALVAVLLVATVLLTSLLAVSANLTVASRRSTADQHVTLKAQYAAESGLALASANLANVYDMLEQMDIPAGMTASTLQMHADNFCNNGSPPPAGVYCVARDASNHSFNRYSLFTSYLDRSLYPNNTRPEDFWQAIFQGVNSTHDVASDSATSSYQVNYGLEPVEVISLGPNAYRFVLNVRASTSVGTVQSGANELSSRTVTQTPTAQVFVDVSQDSFAKYLLFRNNTYSPEDANELVYFTGQDVLNGPVHVNSHFGLANSAGSTPTFMDDFTSADGGPPTFYNGASQADYGSIFQADYDFPVDPIPLPANSNNQLRAAIGGDESNTSAVTEAELESAWGVSPVGDGVYYSANNNAGSSWLGGLFVRGDVDDLQLSVVNNQQRISFTQAGVTTVLQKNNNGTWSVSVNGALVNTLAADPPFNGMVYVQGNVLNMVGDGNEAKGDIAEDMQLTLTTTGDIQINDDLTYSDDPMSNPDAVNVLGIYSSGGSILVNGPANDDINIHATIMASQTGEGFGASENRVNKGLNAKINLVGGLIEDQTQIVARFNNDQLISGYWKNYAYDPRFRDGLAPPYFPLQQGWQVSVSGTDQPGLWRTASRY